MYAVQGFQCLVDDHSGFGQFAADVVAELREDYPTAPTLVFPFRPAHTPPSHVQVPPPPDLSYPTPMHHHVGPSSQQPLACHASLELQVGFD